MDILYLVERLEKLIASSRRMPLVNQVIIKEAEILSIVDQMRTTIPDEVKQARRVLQDKERMLAQAQAEASHILARAREEAEQALNREGLLRTAEQRSQELVHRASEHSQELVHRAEAHAEQLKIDADSYVAETLRNLKEHLTSIETEVSRSILSIERGLASIAAQHGQASVDYTDYEEEEAIKYMEDNAQEMDEQANPHKLQSPEQRVYPMTRPASLANDTIGGPTHPREL